MKDNKYTAPPRPSGRRRRKMKTLRSKGVGRLVQEAVVHFREYHPIDRFSRNLRTLLLEFLMYDGAIEANYLQDLLYDIQGLFELLEVIELENEIDVEQNS
jgi:hypothetical protein